MRGVGARDEGREGWLLLLFPLPAAGAAVGRSIGKPAGAGGGVEASSSAGRMGWRPPFSPYPAMRITTALTTRGASSIVRAVTGGTQKKKGERERATAAATRAEKEGKKEGAVGEGGGRIGGGSGVWPLPPPL